MKWVILFACLIPTLIEAWLDRKGEKRKGKVKDTVWLVVASLAMAGVAWCFGKNPLSVLLLILGWRVLAFDYIVHALLKKYSKGHNHINIWKYTGTTTHFWDQMVAKIPWWLRLVIRVVVFAGVVYCIIEKSQVGHLIQIWPFNSAC